MHKFDNLFKQLITEQDQNVHKVGIFPGAFKPPHIGHYTTAYNACKDNDQVYIFVSEKPRPLSTQNKGSVKDKPDIDRYANIHKSDKYTNNLLGVQTAGVARMTSATAFRSAISIKDKNTVAKNLPDGVDKDKIYQILLQSHDIGSPTYGHVSIEQTMQIWALYKPALMSLTGLSEQQLVIKTSVPSPVKDTYDLVDQLNKSEHAANTSVRLYVGE